MGRTPEKPDPVTMGDLFERHAADRPDCPSRTLDWIIGDMGGERAGEMGPVGYYCRFCGWEWRH